MSPPKRFRDAFLGLFLIATVRLQAAEPDRSMLWDPARPVPKAADIPLLSGVRFQVIQPYCPQSDGYHWLHGVAIVRHDGLWYASFGHNVGSENTVTEVAQGRLSRDEGRTWQPLFALAAGDNDLAVSHGVFLSRQGRLWAFHGCFYGRMNRIHTRAYLLDAEGQRWTPQGVVAESGFWPMQSPQRTADGHWIMAGIAVEASGAPAAVAISHGEDLTRWDVVKIPKPATMKMWGEATILVDGPDILLISRYEQPRALAATSHDHGWTWSMIRETNLPMAASKPYAGVLSTGQRYLIGTTTADSGNRRAPLTIALSRRGEKLFSTIYRIRDSVHDGPGESHTKAALSYPYAVEYDGQLYVVYSNDGARGANRNSAELAVIPLQQLTAP